MKEDNELLNEYIKKLEKLENIKDSLKEKKLIEMQAKTEELFDRIRDSFEELNIYIKFLLKREDTNKQEFKSFLDSYKIKINSIFKGWDQLIDSYNQVNLNDLLSSEELATILLELVKAIDKENDQEEKAKLIKIKMSLQARYEELNKREREEYKED